MGQNNSRGIWGSQSEPKFSSVLEALDDRYRQIRKRLILNEDLMMTYLFQENIHAAYYRMWSKDANAYFRILTGLKKRIEAKKQK